MKANRPPVPSNWLLHLTFSLASQLWHCYSNSNQFEQFLSCSCIIESSDGFKKKKKKMPGVPTPEILIKLTWSWDQDLLTIFYAKNTVSVLLPQSPALFASRRFWERGTHQNDTGTFLEHLHRGQGPSSRLTESELLQVGPKHKYIFRFFLVL